MYRVLTLPDATSITIEAVGQPVGSGLTSAVPNDSNISRYWEFHGLFNKAPAKSHSATAAGVGEDEVHVVVVDEDGLFTGTPNTVLE